MKTISVLKPDGTIENGHFGFDSNNAIVWIPDVEQNVAGKTSVCVIETQNSDGVEWGLSFDGHNPEAHNYFKMVDKETAFRLKEALSAKYPPIS